MHFFHRDQGKDLDIFCWCMQSQKNSQSWRYILVCSWVVSQSFLGDKYSDICLQSVLEDCCLVHKDWDCRDLALQLVLWQEEVGDMLWRGLQYILVCRHSWEYDWPLDTEHWLHNWQLGMGQHNASFDMLCWMGILHWLYIQVCRQHKDLQSNLGYIDMQQPFLCFDKQHLFHKVMGCMDRFSQK